MFKCKICDNQLAQPFLSLGKSPLSNAYDGYTITDLLRLGLWNLSSAYLN